MERGKYDGLFWFIICLLGMFFGVWAGKRLKQKEIETDSIKIEKSAEKRIETEIAIRLDKEINKGMTIKEIKTVERIVFGEEQE